MQENLWGYRKRLEFVDRHCCSRFGSRDVFVLDVGCGNGSQLAIPLANLGYRVTGVDPHAPSIERARQFSGARFVCGPTSSLTGQFDVVIVSEVLEHLHNPESLLADSLRLIKAGGLVIVTVPNGYGLFEFDSRTYYRLRLDGLFDSCYAFRRKLLRKPDPPPRISSSDDTEGHVQRFTLSRLRAMFGTQGLSIIDQRATSFASGPFVANTLGRLPGFIRFNVWIADQLPLAFSSGWMFSLEFAPQGTPADHCNLGNSIRGNTAGSPKDVIGMGK
ncbi:MAG TPA: methyltransferase domain-containing protein [Candidatus Angelobacter sp.]|jgi:SAM-dependent methyltransferase